MDEWTEWIECIEEEYVKRQDRMKTAMLFKALYNSIDTLNKTRKYCYLFSMCNAIK